MLEKIDRFLSKFDNILNFKTLGLIIASELSLTPFYFLAGMYNMPSLYRCICILSIGLSITFLSKAFEIFLGKKK